MPCERTPRRSNAVNSRTFLCRRLLRGCHHLEAPVSVAVQAGGQLAPPAGSSHLYKARAGKGVEAERPAAATGDAAAGLRVQNPPGARAPYFASSTGAFLTQEGLPTTAAVLLRGPSARLHTKPALTWEKGWNSFLAHLSGPAPEGQEQ